MHFRNGTPADADAIAALHTASWRSAYADLMPAAYPNGPLEAEHLAKWRARAAAPSPGRLLLLAEETEGAHGRPRRESLTTP